MMERDWSSPFGGRGISAALMAAEKGIRTRQRALRMLQDGAEKQAGAGSNEGQVADKWQLLRALTQARAAFGLGDRTLIVLHALLSFQPGKGLDGSCPQIVFPSNRELSLRALGMAPATLRRHLAALVEAGLILRRDSPNGKRYRRRGDAMEGEGGFAEEVFGFDLSPLALASSRIFTEQERVEALAREEKRLRTAISLLRRDIAKVLEAAFAEGRAGPFEQFYAELARLVLPHRRAGEVATILRSLLDALVCLAAKAETAYLSSLSEEELSASDARNERHNQYSKTEPFELTGHRQNTETTQAFTIGHSGTQKLNPAEHNQRLGLQRTVNDLATVLRLCPDIADYAGGPIVNFADLARVAETVRAFLGISPGAYVEAKSVMGPQAAAVVIAAILQRATRIRSAGGYLRRLTEKARAGQFSLTPMLRALE